MAPKRENRCWGWLGYGTKTCMSPPEGYLIWYIKRSNWTTSLPPSLECTNPKPMYDLSLSLACTLRKHMQMVQSQRVGLGFRHYDKFRVGRLPSLVTIPFDKFPDCKQPLYAFHAHRDPLSPWLPAPCGACMCAIRREGAWNHIIYSTLCRCLLSFRGSCSWDFEWQVRDSYFF